MTSGLSREQMLERFMSEDPCLVEDTFRRAHAVRLRRMGPTVHLRAIIEFSNCCRQDCLYCGLRRSNEKVARYRMSPEEIVETARAAMKVRPFGTFVLQSGEDPGYPGEALARAIREIKALGAAVTLSVGQRSPQEYAAWKKAGADRYLLKFETGDPVLFKKLKPTTTLERRLRCLYVLRDLGYQVGSGIILGLPGQTALSVIDDIRFLGDLDVDMVSIGPFIPHPDTPLGMAREAREIEGSYRDRPLLFPLEERGLVAYTLKAVALARLEVPRANIPATTALGVIGRTGAFACVGDGKTGTFADARAVALLCGANVIMVDITPARYRYAYSIYPGKSVPGWQLEAAVRYAEELIKATGMEIDPGRGDAPERAGSAGRGTTAISGFERS